MLLTISLAALVAGCGGDDAAMTATEGAPQATGGAAKKTVTIEDFKFGAPVEVAAGGKVTWTNRDTAPHNAVGDEFMTADLDRGESDTVTFDRPGTYDYVCTFHAFMKGSVVVR